MLEKYFITDKPLSFWKGDYLKGTICLVLAAVPNFLLNSTHIIMIFTDI